VATVALTTAEVIPDALMPMTPAIVV
jgi:hypothetical protein